MAQYTLGIAALTTSANLSTLGWTKSFGTGDFVVTVDAAAIYGKKLVRTGANVVITQDALNGDADRDDFEVLIVATMNLAATDDDLGVWGGITGDQLARYRLGYGVGDAQYKEKIQSTDTGGVDSYEISQNISDPGTTKQVVRVRYNSTALTSQVRRWDWGTAEPGTWDSFDLDSGDGVEALTVGAIGFGGDSGVTTFDVEHFSVGTNGDTAPFAVGPLVGGKLRGRGILGGRLVA